MRPPDPAVVGGPFTVVLADDAVIVREGLARIVTEGGMELLPNAVTRKNS